MRSIIILGTGGNCIDILDTLNEINRVAGKEAYNCAGFLGDDRDKAGKEYFGVKVIGTLRDAPKYPQSFFINGIGSPFTYYKKESIIASTKMPLDRFETVIHPSASVSSMARVGKGTVILQNVTVASNVRIGDHVMILPNSVISHDSILGDYTIIAGGVCVSGGVTVGRSCYLGTNSSIIGNIEIGDAALVGMGSVVRKSVPPRAVVAGNPLRQLRRLSD